MAARVLRPRRRGRGARRAPGDDRDRGRAGRHGRPALGRGLRRRQGAQRRAAPRTPTGSASARSTPATASATIVCGAPNVAAGQTVAVALPGARMPGGEKLRKAKLRGVASEGMILSAAELEIGEDADGIMVLDDGPGAGHAAGRGAAAGRAGAGARGDPEPRPTASASTASPARSTRSPARRWPPSPGPRTRRPRGEGEVADYASVTVEVPELCPRFTARVFTDVDDRPLAALAAGAADRGRAAADQQRRRHHQLRDAADRAAAARLRPRQGPGRGADRARRGGRREDDDPRRRRARRSTPRRSWSATRTARPGSPGSWAARSPRSPTATTRVLLEVANWNGTNILRTSRLLGLRSEASSRFEKQLHPELCMRAQRIASRLLVELCGAKLVPGTIDVAAEIPAAAASCGCAPRGSRACSGWRSRRPTRSPTWSGSASASRPTARTSRSTVPPDRHYDVTREVDLIEEVGRVHGLDEHLPTTLPAVGRPGRRPQPRAAAAAPGRGRAARPRLRPDRRLELHRPRRGRRGCGSPPTTRGPSRSLLANPLSEDQSAMRTTLLGSLLDVAAPQPRPRRRARRPLRVRPRLPASRRRPTASRSGPSTRWPAASPGERPAPFAEPHRLGGLAVGPLVRAVLARRRRAGRLLRAQGRARGARRPARRRARASSAAPEPFLHPGRAAAVSVGGAPAGWIGEVHPLVCREWDLEAAVGFEIDAGAAARRRRPPARRPTRTSPPSRPSTRTWPSSSRPRSRRGRGARGGPGAAAASCCARPRSSTSTRASSSARAARASPCGSSSAPPTAPSPTRRSPACASAIEAELERDRRDAP